ncbi:Cupin domain-containing protein [Lentibacillus persicus]|uniref:Cupin domain-containing protein n=1 Tax=Lentibacillus persicus TaxID=640948 RepID=A0A1I1W047_9BACI|nr:AraC family transcriptional regulator [Lentibacillus persicus]SFD88455.1 Cupin domain-containing protein [Lentibacillus persicus]
MLRDDQLRVFWISRIDYEKNSGVKKHYHSDIFQLLFIMDGEGVIEINGQEYPLMPKYAYFISKENEHHFYFKKPSSTIDIKFDIISSDLEELIKTQKIQIPYFMSDSSKIKELFKTSIHNKQNDKLTPYLVDVLFKNILLLLVQETQEIQNSSHDSAPAMLQRNTNDFPIQKFLIENLHQKISLDDISKHFNYHPHYIIDLFKQKLNTTPMKYLQLLRIEKAKEFLEFSNLSISEIADKIGLSTPYFSRLFHSMEGTSPTDYRDQTRTVVGKPIILDENFISSLPKQPPISNQK